MSSESYRLLDFGAGRKLEQFGPAILDRLCPAADFLNPASPALWRNATVVPPSSADALPALPASWHVTFPLGQENTGKQVNAGKSIRFQLKITPYGHVGVFPEQFQHWCWLFDIAASHCTSSQRVTTLLTSNALTSNQSDAPANQPAESVKHFKALNLFAYTGGSTMALAAAGSEITHVDASAPAVAWARSNAQLNNLANQPIRWIVEDVRKFVQREIRRGKHYDIIVLDPPSYGHGPQGKAWSLALDWEELLAGCLQLLAAAQPARLLWTGHSDIPTALQLAQRLSRERRWQIDSGRSCLTDASGRTLDAGYFVRATSIG